MRTFLELLPYRIEQMLCSRTFRSLYVRFIRKQGPHEARSCPAPAAIRRLFVDMAVISGHDAKTGIQRVVRALARALVAEAPTQWDIRFVAAPGKGPYCEIAWPLLDPGNPFGNKMAARPGDVFVGLDYSLNEVRRHRRQLARFRRAGGTLWFLVHDLLPLNHPEWFSHNTVIRYRAWLSIIAGLADGFLCNSAQTDIELRKALACRYGLQQGYRTQILPMGHSIVEAHDTTNIQAIPSRIDTATPFVLMVGTLEPRKGHRDIIAAFNILWQQGRPERLVLVGRLGWKVQALRDLIVGDPEYGDRLLWFEDVNDAELLTIYQTCTGVVIASLAEGFGLPLIEALGHGKPVLARDLAVFRIHDGKGVRFFPAQATAIELANITARWLNECQQGTIAVELPKGEWRDAVRTMLAAIEVKAAQIPAEE
ncbi:glycosyltransferase family 4 protein [Sphingobium sp. JS3065]|uniref:glycosyltransferase family 4 protein n=1 Tax=Sphingobium sp. JS3065 TaxID=2970925 RepID=UPI0022645807|nr:glycosyltransferase family 1 protein [Sphingobium sp. JS3065]UZW55083.1 glycosyltransferase family 4 protein [Sphingobium sp. JS3065]